MRWLSCALFGVVFALGLLAQDEPREVPDVRYKVEANYESYPQATPKEALSSVMRAIDRKRFDYVAAHLLDPAIVDRRIQETKVTFATCVQDVQTKLTDDPEAVRELRKFLVRGEITENGDTAMVKVAELPQRVVMLKKIGKRWFMENRRTPPPAAPEPEPKKDM